MIRSMLNKDPSGNIVKEGKEENETRDKEII